MVVFKKPFLLLVLPLINALPVFNQSSSSDLQIETSNSSLIVNKPPQLVKTSEKKKIVIKGAKQDGDLGGFEGIIEGLAELAFPANVDFIPDIGESSSRLFTGLIQQPLQQYGQYLLGDGSSPAPLAQTTIAPAQQATQPNIVILVSGNGAGSNGAAGAGGGASNARPVSNSQSNTNSNRPGISNGQGASNFNNPGISNGASNFNNLGISNAASNFNNPGISNGQSFSNSNRPGISNGQSFSNSNRPGNSNGQSVSNSNRPGISNGQSFSNSNRPGISNGQSFSNSNRPEISNGQGTSKFNNPGISNGQGTYNFNNPGISNGASNFNNPGLSNGQSFSNSNRPGISNEERVSNSNGDVINNEQQSVFNGNRPITANRQSISNSNKPGSNVQAQGISDDIGAGNSNVPATDTNSYIPGNSNFVYRVKSKNKNQSGSNNSPGRLGNIPGADAISQIGGNSRGPPINAPTASKSSIGFRKENSKVSENKKEDYDVADDATKSPGIYYLRVPGESPQISNDNTQTVLNNIRLGPGSEDDERDVDIPISAAPQKPPGTAYKIQQSTKPQTEPHNQPIVVRRHPAPPHSPPESPEPNEFPDPPESNVVKESVNGFANPPQHPPPNLNEFSNPPRVSQNQGLVKIPENAQVHTIYTNGLPSAIGATGNVQIFVDQSGTDLPPTTVVPLVSTVSTTEDDDDDDAEEEGENLVAKS